jgi:hypothetical protein
MSTLVSEDNLARAWIDPAFRQQLLAVNLHRLLTALNTMRHAAVRLAFSAKIPINRALRRSWLGAERTAVFPAFSPKKRQDPIGPASRVPAF